MTAPHSASENGRTKTLAIVGLGLVLVAFVASRLMGGGGGGGGTDAAGQTPATAPSVTVAPVTPAPGTVTPGATGTPAAPAAPTVETFEVFTTKNPFLALRTAAASPVAGPAVVTPAPAAPAPAAPAPAPVAAAPTGQTVTAAPGVVTAAPTGVQATSPVRTTRVAVLDVFTEGDRVLANVRVNDTVSKVGAGDSFANNFKVVSLDLETRCGKFLYGDDQFRLCRGEELLK
jgi:hypothetical protein